MDEKDGVSIGGAESVKKEARTLSGALTHPMVTKNAKQRAMENAMPAVKPYHKGGTGDTVKQPSIALLTAQPH